MCFLCVSRRRWQALVAAAALASPPLPDQLSILDEPWSEEYPAPSA